MQKILNVDEKITLWKEMRLFKTNEQALKSLDTVALAWVLMPNDSYDFCTEKSCCKAGDASHKTCIEGHIEWLKQQPSDEDLRMFASAIWNQEVTLYNKSIAGEDEI